MAESDWEDINSSKDGDWIDVEDKKIDQKPSIATQGASFLTQHPFKALLQGAPETLTGKSMLERSQESPISIAKNEPAWAYIPRAMGTGLARDIGAMGVDMATSPTTAITAGLGALKPVQAAGEALMATKPMQALARFATKERGSPVSFLKEKGKLSKEINVYQEKYAPGLGKEDISRKIGEDIVSTRKQISQNRDKFDNLINQEAEIKSQTFQDKLPEYFKNNSKIYGNKLDNISDELALRGQSITRGEFNQILDDVLRESQEDFLAAGKPMDEIIALKNKYNPSFETGTMEANTFGGMQQPRWNASDPLNFKEVVNDIKSVKNALSSKAKFGYRYAPEDVVAAKLMGKWGDFIADRVPEFQQLNQEYKPVINAMKLAGKTFKPYSTEFETKAGTQFLKNYAQGKLEAGQEKLLDFIQKGTDNYPGVGNITQRLKHLGDSKISEEADLTKFINDLVGQKERVKDLISKEALMQDKKDKVIRNIKLIGSLTGLGIEETSGPKVIRHGLFGR